MMMCIWNDSDEAGNGNIKHGEDEDTDFEDGHLAHCEGGENDTD